MEAQASVPVQNRYGLHARPAMKFVERANHFTSDVYVSKDGEEVNGKSIMGLMTLAAECGSLLRLRAIAKETVDG